MRGGMEAVYDDMPVRLGFGQFAPLTPARGPMFSARSRAKLHGEPPPAVVQEGGILWWRRVELCTYGCYAYIAMAMADEHDGGRSF